MKINEAKKTPQILERGGKRILTNGINIREEGSDAGGSKDVA